jgi:hypothetical protein
MTPDETVTDRELQAAFLAARALGKVLPDEVLRAVILTDRRGRAPGRPAKGTQEWDLWIAAIEVATDAPLRHSPITTHGLIYWPTIERLRAALDALCIDWRTAKAKEASR